MPTPAASRPLTLVLGPVLGVALLLAGCSGTAEPQPLPHVADPSAPRPPATPEPSTPGPSTAEPSTPGPSGGVPTTAEPPEEVSIAFVGDVMLGRSIGERIIAGEDPFAGVAAQLAEADLVVGTLETTVGEGGQAEDKSFTFQAPPESVNSLVSSGFDLVSLANNHSYDYGADGLTETIQLLDDGELAHVGAGANAAAARTPVVLDVGGVEVAFLSYVDVPDDWTGYRNRDWAATDSSPGVAWADPEVIADDVAAASEDADHVVVLVHAGVEGSQQPSEVQYAAADAALEAGATAVIGGHPHVLQGYRHQDGRLTAWSLGNFVFDGFGDDPVASQSAILTLTLDHEELTDVAWAPVAIVDGLPVALDPTSSQGRAILEGLESLPGS